SIPSKSHCEFARQDTFLARRRILAPGPHTFGRDQDCSRRPRGMVTLQLIEALSQNDSAVVARNWRKKERCCDTSINAVRVSHGKVASQVGVAKRSKWDSAASARPERRLTTARISDRSRDRAADQGGPTRPLRPT